jgi:hypothetical protein
MIKHDVLNAGVVHQVPARDLSPDTSASTPKLFLRLPTTPLCRWWQNPPGNI